jgi:hypothetical protein
MKQGLDVRKVEPFLSHQRTGGCRIENPSAVRINLIHISLATVFVSVLYLASVLL